MLLLHLTAADVTAIKLDNKCVCVCLFVCVCLQYLSASLPAYMPVTTDTTKSAKLEQQWELQTNVDLCSHDKECSICPEYEASNAQFTLSTGPS